MFITSTLRRTSKSDIVLRVFRHVDGRLQSRPHGLVSSFVIRKGNAVAWTFGQAVNVVFRMAENLSGPPMIKKFAHNPAIPAPGAYTERRSVLALPWPEALEGRLT